MLGVVTWQWERVQVVEHIISKIWTPSYQNLEASVPLTQEYIVKNGTLAIVERTDTANIIINESRL